MAALTLSAATAFAGHWVPHTAMPAGIGYATDAKGARHPNTACVRDAIFAPSPRCPLGNPNSQDWEHIKWEQVESDGLYRLDIDLTTGRVTNVTIVKSGTKQLNDLSILAFQTRQVERNRHSNHDTQKVGGSDRQKRIIPQVGHDLAQGADDAPQVVNNP